LQYFNDARRLGGVLAFLMLAGTGVQAQAPESITVTGALDRQPLSVASFPVAALHDAGVTNLSDLGQRVPGLHVDRYGASIQPTLRGIGVQNVLGPGVESDVAVYLDGFRQNNLDSLLFDFADLTRVDVLKGPQGTQFGQNAVAGAILLTTADPGFTSGGNLRVSYGAFNDVRVRGYANAALSDTLAADLSVYHRESDNYFTDIASGKPSATIRSLALRSKLLFQPDVDTSLVLAAHYSNMDDPTGLAYSVGNPSAALYHDAFGVPIAHTITPYRTSLGRALHANPRAWSVSLAGTFELNWATLTTRTQFRSQRGEVTADLDGTSIQSWNLDYSQTDQTITQEINLSGKGGGKLQWRTGFIYSNDLGGLTYYAWQDIFNTGAATPLLHSRIRVATDSVGLFGTVDYALADDWTLSAGGRLTHERKSMRSALLMAPFLPGAGAKDWTELTPRLALSHAAGEDGTLYLSVTQGFKSGNFNYIGVGTQAPVKAERVTQYEAGYKYAGGAWTLAASAYFSRYRDLQAFTYQSACACFQFSNAPRAEVYGAEAEAGLALNEQFSLRAALAYTHARYREFVGEAPTGAPFVPPFYGYATGPANFAGGPMIRSPDWTGNLGLSWRRPSDSGLWSAEANLSLTSTVPFTPDRQLAQGG
jgi:iron complex outermembrane receptor protein